MKFRFHWGWAIAVFYTSFVAIMVYFVIYSKTVDHSLVRDNYYDYDIGYEELIGEKRRNSSTLNEPVIVRYLKADKQVKVFFPKEINKIKGEIWFYRVNNEKLDSKFEIAFDTTYVQVIDVKDFAAGKWKVNVEWVGDGRNFLDSQDIYLK